MTKNIRLAIDIGGTFTDAVLDIDGKQVSAKVPTTPAAPEEGFLAGAQAVLALAALEPGAVTTIIHGTTLATNALIERKGARTALVTTEGFRDSLEIGYEARFDQYDLQLEKTPPLVPRALRFTVPERLSAAGEVIEGLDEAALRDIAAKLRAEEVDSLAVGFLHAYANGAHERRAGEILHEELPDLPISLSSEVCPEIREYERLSTTVANAYVRPRMAAYLAALDERLSAGSFTAPLFLVTSAGGITTLEMAQAFPIRLVESGPSGGAVLAEITAEACGEKSVLSYDMGGTTAKVCLIDGYRPRTSREFEAARAARFAKGSGLPLRLPVVEMIEIGAGGGSIAGVDALQRLTVGPESAGCRPRARPVTGKRRDQAPTVTDADLAHGPYRAGGVSPSGSPRSSIVPDKARQGGGRGASAPTLSLGDSGRQPSGHQRDRSTKPWPMPRGSMPSSGARTCAKLHPHRVRRRRRRCTPPAWPRKLEHRNG